MKNKRQVIFFTIFILVILILDLITKFIAMKNGKAIISSQTENNSYYILMSIIAVLMIIRYISNDNAFIKNDTKVVLGFGIAGAIGNAIDRFFYGYVIAFIKIANSFNINLAYIYIIITWIGMAAILTKNSYRFLKERKNKKGKIDEYKKNKSI